MTCPTCKKDSEWSRIVYREEKSGDMTWTVKVYMLHCGHTREERI